MKIVISGKGGSGKSTLSVLISRAMAGMGYRVLLVDADESNMGLEALAGVSPPVHLLAYLGGKKGFKAKLNQKIMMDNPAGIFSGKQGIDDIPDECIVSSDGIGVAVIGKIHDFGEGCACPVGVLAKKFLASIKTSDKEVVLVDTEAGVEHFGRGIEGGCDMILGVVDPTAESFRLAEKMKKMAKYANKDIYFILNKVEPSIGPFMMQQLDPESVIGSIPRDNSIFLESLQGRELTRTLPEVDQVCRRLEKFSQLSL